MIYLDNAATTRVTSGAIEIMLKLLDEEFGNPSSLHELGIRAESRLRGAREQVSAALGCEPREVYFTSGGTEGNNTAIFGAANALGRQGKHIITTAIEHPSVLEPIKRLHSLGYDVTFLPPCADGGITAKQVCDALRKDTVLISVMTVNNETGVVMPVGEIAAAVKRAGSRALVHTDAVQAFLKLPESPAASGADLITISGHKIHAPKGVGALYIKKGVRITPLIFGGGQESDMRSGTESVPLIVAFGAACREVHKTLESDIERMRDLSDILCNRLDGLKGVHIISPGDAPHILSVAFEKYPSEVSMRMLESRGIYVSSGSACGRGRQSHVLKAMRLPDGIASGTVRISLSRYTSRQDINQLISAVKECLVSE